MSQNGHEDDDSQSTEAPPPKTGRPPGMQIVDRRKPERITIPFYIVEQYGGELGMNGLALYLGLCYHVGRQKVVWPSMNTLARELGTSRSTIERTMRTLKELGLVLVEPCIDGHGQRSNTIYLIDPGVDPEHVQRVPPVPQTAPSDRRRPRRQDDGARAVKMTAPPRQDDGAHMELDPSEERESAPAPLAAPLGDNIEREKNELVQLWMRLLVCASHRQRAQHKNEITSEVGELLRRGFDPQALEHSMEDSDRDRSEWPRLWRARQTAPKRAPKSYEALTEQNRQEWDGGQERGKDLIELNRRGLSMTELARLKSAGLDIGQILCNTVGANSTN